eukprot:761986-Hanusia_phi.AAC.1
MALGQVTRPARIKEKKARSAPPPQSCCNLGKSKGMVKSMGVGYDMMGWGGLSLYVHGCGVGDCVRSNSQCKRRRRAGEGMAGARGGNGGGEDMGR